MLVRLSASPFFTTFLLRARATRPGVSPVLGRRVPLVEEILSGLSLRLVPSSCLLITTASGRAELLGETVTTFSVRSECRSAQTATSRAFVTQRWSRACVAASCALPGTVWRGMYEKKTKMNVPCEIRTHAVDTTGLAGCVADVAIVQRLRRFVDLFIVNHSAKGTFLSAGLIDC